MASYVSSHAGVQSGFPATSLSVIEPTVADGHLMVIELYMSDATGNNLAASGWENVTVTPVAVGGADFDFVIATKIRSGSASLNVTWTNGGFTSGTIHAFTGQHATDEIESITAGTAVAATGKVAPSVSSTYDNSLLADMYVEDGFSAWTVDADFTERYDGADVTGVGLATEQLSANGATGTDTHSSVSGDGGIAVRMVIVDDVPTGDEEPTEVVMDIIGVGIIPFAR